MDNSPTDLSHLLGQLDGYAPPDFGEPTSAEIEKLQLYRIMANQIPQRILWKDLDSKYVWANRRFADDCSVEFPEQLVGKSDYDMPWTREQADAFRADDQLVMQTGQPKINIIEPQTRSDGSFAWLHTNKVPIFDKQGKVIGLIGTYEDITERAQAEIALRRYQQMVESIFDHIPVAVFWKDLKSRYIGCNVNYASDAGFTSPKEIVGKTDADLPWSDEQAEKFRNDDNNVMETGESKLNFVEKARQVDGSTAWLQVSKVPLRDPDGKVIGVLGTYQNITEQIEAREALRRSRLAALEERQRLARDLHDAVSQTLWTASLLSDVIPTLWDDDRQEGERSLAQLRRLTKGAVAEMRMLLLELRPAALVETDLAELLEHLAQAIMSRKKLDISVSAESELVMSFEIKVGLYRIAQEALNNVARHSRAAHAAVILRSDDDLVTLSISDDGRGFDVASPALDRMGLSIMRERAEAIPARVTIESELESGTTITVIWDRQAQL